MSSQSIWKSLHLRYFSRPAADRSLYRAVNRLHPRVFLELGIGVGIRAMRTIEIASWWTPREELRYTGIDLFEARNGPESPGIALKTAYRNLRTTGARIQLVPGSAASTLNRIAYSIAPVDVVIASTPEDLTALAAAYAFAPRLLHAGSIVFANLATHRECGRFRLMTREQIASCAVEALRDTRSAA